MIKFITISREFGSGGHTIGKRVAEALGWQFYDKELIKHISRASGLDEKFVDEHDEHASASGFLGYVFSARAANGISVDDMLWLVQRDVIMDLVEKGEPCVIVGRCADFILRDRTDALHTLIYADPAYREERIVRLYGQSENSPQKRILQKDKKRKTNYKYFTGREWGLPLNYDVCLNSGKLGEDACVETIVHMVKKEAEK